MRSHARLKNHPIHPMLIALPIGFGTGTIVFDLVGRLGNWSTLWTAAAYLAIGTVVGGVVAAIPGLIDYFAIVPPNSSAKKRATYHMVVNVTALSLIVLGAAFRDRDTWRPGAATLLFEAAGMFCMSAGGWLGGTLVFRNQIGVDHRYAKSGTWTETRAGGLAGETIIVASADELQRDQMKLIHVGGRRIVLARIEEGYVACDDRCTHRGASLADGTLACGTVQCPWHGSQFDVKSGAVKSGPAETPLRTYVVRELDGQIKLTLPEA